jgi:hypothetical protein
MDHWYCKIADEEIGPLTATHLRVLAAQGRLFPEDLLRRGEAGPWVSARRVKGLFGGSTMTLKAVPLDGGVAASEHDATSIPPAMATGGFHHGEAADSFAAGDEPPAKEAAAFGFLAEDIESPPRTTAHSVVGGPVDVKRQKRLMIAALCGLVGVLALLMVALVVTVVLKGRGGDSGEPDEVAQDAAAKSGGQTAEHDASTDATAKKPAAEVVYLDATKDSWKAGDVTVQILAAEVGKVRLLRSGKLQSRTDEDYLILRLRLTNASDTRKIEYTSWSAMTPRPKLVDNFGNEYFMPSFPSALTVDGQQRKTSIYPEKSIHDVLVFQKPADRAKLVKLHLSGDVLGFGKPGDFAIPTSMLIRIPWTGDALPGGAPPKDDAAASKPRDPQEKSSPDAKDRGNGLPNAANNDKKTPEPGKKPPEPGATRSEPSAPKPADKARGGTGDPFRELPQSPPRDRVKPAAKTPQDAANRAPANKRSAEDDFGIGTVGDDQPTMDAEPATEKPSRSPEKRSSSQPPSKK